MLLPKEEEHRRLYIDLPDDIVEKAHELALDESRYPKQQIEYLAKRAIEEAFRTRKSARKEREPRDVVEPAWRH